MGIALRKTEPASGEGEIVRPAGPPRQTGGGAAGRGSDAQGLQQFGFQQDLVARLGQAGPSIRNTSSTRSPRVMTLAVCRLMRYLASTLAIEYSRPVRSLAETDSR
jgi:hypothetical protein